MSSLLDELAQRVIEVRQASGFKYFPHPTEPEAVKVWLQQCLFNPDYYLATRYHETCLVAFCLGKLVTSEIPPNPVSVEEVAWWAAPGHDRQAVKVWEKVVEWGKLKGALVAGRTKQCPPKRVGVAHEVHTYTYIGD